MLYVFFGIAFLVTAMVLFVYAGVERSYFLSGVGTISTVISIVLLMSAAMGTVGEINRFSGLYEDSIYRLLAQVNVPAKGRRLLVVQDRKNPNAVYCVYNTKDAILPEGTIFIEKSDKGGAKPFDTATIPTDRSAK